jgi:hypothetical protein
MNSRKISLKIEHAISGYLKKRNWSQPKRVERVRSILTQFHQWLKLKNDTIENISLLKVDLFIDWMKRGSLKKKVRREYTWVILNYLSWLSHSQIYKISHLTEMVPNIEYLSYRNYGSLPHTTEEYLQSETKRLKRARSILLRTTLTQFHFSIEHSCGAKPALIKENT